MEIITTTAEMPVGTTEVETTQVDSTEVVAEPTAPQDPAPAEKPPETKERTFSQKELDEIISKRLGKAQRGWERQQQQLLETALRARTEQQTIVQPQTAPGEPDPTKYNDYAEYLRAVSRYEAEQVLTRTVERNQREREEMTQQERQRSMQQNFERQVELGSQKFADFEDVALNPQVPITAGMAQVIAESDVGADLAYYLGRNVEEAARIAGLSFASAAKELGKIEAKLTTPVAPAVTKAPAPVEPVGGRATTVKDPSEMSAAEFTAWRKKFIGQRGR